MQERFQDSIHDLVVFHEQLNRYFEDYKSRYLAKWLQLCCEGMNAQREHYAASHALLQRAADSWRSTLDNPPPPLPDVDSPSFSLTASSTVASSAGDGIEGALRAGYMTKRGAVKKNWKVFLSHCIFDATEAMVRVDSRHAPILQETTI